MPDLRTPLPTRRAELVIRPLGDGGQYVVKDPSSGEFFHLGREEHFLLTQLDGEKDATAVCKAFEQRFGDPLTDDELDGFITMAREQGLLVSGEQGARSKEPDSDTPRSQLHAPRSQQSLLYWRKKIFDPDRLFNWLEPQVRFFWTRGFLVVSAGSIVLATLILWSNAHELAGSFQHALRWETLVWAWLVMLAVATLHEFAHGLTCKHYGGEVREIGFLLMFFMPCFYCNVSDAWLFRERSKRLWVTFAGGYFELFLWALAVFVWRLTLPGSFPHYLAFLIVASSGLDTFFNFNPLIKLDGYYLLSDWAEVPNLQQRGLSCFKAHLRRWLWGARRPTPEPRGRFLLGYGLVSWLYMVVFLSLMLWGMFWFFGNKWGVTGMSAVTLLGLVSARGLVKDTTAGEARRMISSRQKRLVAWLLVLGGLAALLCLVEMNDHASGKFEVRPAVRTELRAPLAGFLKELYFDEGDQISSGWLVARIDIPDLATRRAQKQAEVAEASAQLRLLEAGTRPEEIHAQRQRVQRAALWRDLASRDLEKMRQALAEDLARLDTQIAACQAELDVAKDSYDRAATLVDRRAITEAEYHEVQGKYRVCQARLDQARAEKRARQANGTLEAETELARRQKELADGQAALVLLEAGTRSEAIEAERARVARLTEELRYLERLAERLEILAPLSGTITTARLKEKAGQYVHQGELICTIEESSRMEVEISLSEQDVTRIDLHQVARLKARSQPFKSFQTKVDRIAPAAGKGEVQSTVIVYCRLDNRAAELRPGMTGYARIDTGRQPIGRILLNRILRFVRTEFWW